MNYRIVNGKWVINKTGVYFSLTPNELLELKKIIKDIDSGNKEFYIEDSRKTKDTK